MNGGGAKNTPVPNAWDDIKIRLALGASFALSAFIFLARGWGSLKNASGSALSGFLLIAAGLFFLLIAFLYAIRLRPVNKLPGIAPTAAAVAGTCLIWIVPLLAPPASLPFSVKMAATGFLLVGQMAAILTLFYLGRSFSILPEGRKLVTTGPYRFIRHPLYVAEAFIMMGAVVVFLSPWAVLIAVLQLALQFRRMHYEEELLGATFPEYHEYSRHTARLIPGLY